MSESVSEGSGPIPGTADGNGPDLGLRSKILSLPTLAGYAVATAVLAFAASKIFDINWGETWDLAKSTDPLFYGLALVLYYTSFWFRGWRWIFIARSAGLDHQPGTRMPSRSTASVIILMGWFANAVAFLRIGDAYRAYAFSKESGARFSFVLGTIFAERIQDMVAVLILLLIATLGILVASDADAPVGVIVAALGLVSALIVLLVAMRFFGLRLAGRLPKRLQAGYENFHSSALASFRPRHIPAQLTLGMIGWLLETARLYLVAHGMGLDVDIWVALFAALAGAMLSTIPTPGGLGFVEAGLTGVLIVLGLSDTDAFALTVVDRTISWISIIVIGGGVFFAWQVFRARRPAVLPSAGASAPEKAAASGPDPG